MRDRVVQYPNRYEMQMPDGSTQTVTLTPSPGTITEIGTPLNKATLLDSEAQSLYALDDSGTVSDALKRNGYASYMAFVGNVNQEQIDCAFGKNNEQYIGGIGFALAMYAKYKDPSVNIETDLGNLINQSSLEDIATNQLALTELFLNDSIVNLCFSSTYATSILFADMSGIAKTIKSDKSMLQKVISNAKRVDAIRNSVQGRASFNRNRIRLLAPGAVSWTVPNDFPTNFIHVQLIGGGGVGTYRAGQYVQGIIDVTPGQVITGSIGNPGIGANAGEVTFGGLIAGVNTTLMSQQSGAFLVEGTAGRVTKISNLAYYGAGFEGGEGGAGNGSVGSGDGTLGNCEGTGGKNSTTIPNPGTDGGGGGALSNYGGDHRFPGGGGYGGQGGEVILTAGSVSYPGGGGSGAIVITCPDGYTPENVVWNTVGGITEWRRDVNVFNDFS